MMKVLFVSMMLMPLTLWASGEAPEPASKAVKYKGAKDLNFDELLIEGALKRPELSVVTGDSDQDQTGLLRLRENFIDRMTVDASEEIQ